MIWHHAEAQAYFGASVFWLRRLSAFPDEDHAVSDWQTMRNGRRRGIVEIAAEDS